MSGPSSSEHPLLSPLSSGSPDSRELKPSTTAQRLSTVTEFSYSTFCINKSWLFQRTLAQKMKVETIACSCKLKKKERERFKWTFSYSTFQQKTSTDNLLSKIIWILAASPAEAILNSYFVIFTQSQPNPPLKELLKQTPEHYRHPDFAFSSPRHY